MKLIEVLSDLGSVWTFVDTNGYAIPVEEIAGLIGAAEDTSAAAQALLDVLKALGEAPASTGNLIFGLPEIGVPAFDQLGIAGVAQVLTGRQKVGERVNYDFEHDVAVGRIIRYDDGSAEWVDLQGRTTATREPHTDGGWTKTDYEHDDDKNPDVYTRKTSTSYDRDGKRTSETVATEKGEVTTFYDENGKVTDRETRSADGLSSTWERYDKKGNLIEKSVTTGKEEDGATVYTTKTYDGSGKLISETTKRIEHEDDTEENDTNETDTETEPDSEGDEETLPRDPNDDTANPLSDAAAEMLEKASGAPGAEDETILKDPDAGAKGTLPDGGDGEPRVPGELILVDPDTIVFITGSLPDPETLSPIYGTTQPGPDAGVNGDGTPPDPDSPWAGTDFTDDALNFWG